MGNCQRLVSPCANNSHNHGQYINTSFSARTNAKEAFSMCQPLKMTVYLNHIVQATANHLHASSETNNQELLADDD
jgi:hypothetical protein